jgi:hypothetical protein
MDIEVFEAIESLRTDITRVETSLRAEFGNEMGKLRVEMVTKAEFHGELHGLRNDMAGDMASMREELKRHTDIRFESLRDDIRIVAEGFASMSAQIASLRPPFS